MTAARVAVLSVGGACALATCAFATCALATCALAAPVQAAVEESTSYDLWADSAGSPGWRESALQGGGVQVDQHIGRLSWHLESGTLEGLHEVVNFWPSIHWLSSANVATSMAALGYTWRNLKLEGALFRARESDRARDTELIKLDATSRRLAYDLGPNWALQVSRGYHNSPDRLSHEADRRRTTISATYYGHLDQNPWHTTLALGRSRDSYSGPSYLMESAMRFGRQHTVFGRIERGGNDELFREDEAPHQRSYRAKKITLGYLYDVVNSGSTQVGVGGLLSRRMFPDELLPYYAGKDTSAMIFMRLQMQFSAR